MATSTRYCLCDPSSPSCRVCRNKYSSTSPFVAPRSHLLRPPQSSLHKVNNPIANIGSVQIIIEPRVRLPSLHHALIAQNAQCPFCNLDCDTCPGPQVYGLVRSRGDGPQEGERAPGQQRRRRGCRWQGQKGRTIGWQQKALQGLEKVAQGGRGGRGQVQRRRAQRRGHARRLLHLPQRHAPAALPRVPLARRAQEEEKVKKINAHRRQVFGPGDGSDERAQIALIA